jgi:flavin-dependent dehydrogenase
VLPRKRLDEIICQAAVAAGARMFAPVRFVAPLRDGAGRVVGARLQHGERVREVKAPWLVLASGAQPQATIAAGLCDRRTPSGIALRGYVENAAMTPRITSLEVVWHKRLSPGYGWIFPCGGDVFNIGVGVAQSHREGKDGKHAMQDVNLREVFAAFKALYAPARELVEGGRWRGDPGHELKGAPLRCSLEGARLEAPGVLVTGEAAGSTYAFTGEGIGKAMETALHAAEAILAHPASDASDASRRGDPRRLRGARPLAQAALRHVRGSQSRQRPSLADRPARVERQAQPAPRPAHGRRARGDAHPDRRGDGARRPQAPGRLALRAALARIRSLRSIAVEIARRGASSS